MLWGMAYCTHNVKVLLTLVAVKQTETTRTCEPVITGRVADYNGYTMEEMIHK
jgi:hypothetical protein